MRVKYMSSKKNKRKTKKSSSVAWDIETGSSKLEERVIYLSGKSVKATKNATRTL